MSFGDADMGADIDAEPQVVEQEQEAVWEWSGPACQAFADAARDPRHPGRLVVRRGLEAAFRVEGPRLFAAQLEYLVRYLGSHPDLSTRVLVLNADPDGKVRLAIDIDMVRYVLKNELPVGVEIVPAETAAGEVPDA